MTDTNGQAPQGFSFPLEIEMRAMIDASDESKQQVVQMMQDYWGSRLKAVSEVPSRTGKWLSLKCLVTANSREELEDAYTRLKALPSVKLTL